MPLSGLDIYKLLAKTNCRKCGFVTCLAFAMQLAKKAVSVDKCPYVSQEVKKIIEAASQPPIRLVSFGAQENKLELGNESVLFRHEEKFRNPCAIGFIIDDNLSDSEIKSRVNNINALSFERIGQKLSANIVALRQISDSKRFIDALRLICQDTSLGLVILAKDLNTLKQALEIAKEAKPLVYYNGQGNLDELAGILKDYQAPVVVCSADLEKLSQITSELNSKGVKDIVIDTGKKQLKEKLWDFTQIRRLALKKAKRSLGYPILAMIENKDPYEEAQEAATYIAKYASIVLLSNIESWLALALLTLRQNIYTDPQKPLQIEPKVYPIGKACDKSPVLVTTNFSLTYYTVAQEVEASKVPSYILSVDTEGMSVLTAWAAEKFTPEKISETLKKFNLKALVSHNRLIIPGYVAVMSGDLEEKSGCQIIVGPKEAAGIPSFLKNLSPAGK